MLSFVINKRRIFDTTPNIIDKGIRITAKLWNNSVNVPSPLNSFNKRYSIPTLKKTLKINKIGVKIIPINRNIIINIYNIS